VDEFGLSKVATPSAFYTFLFTSAVKYWWSDHIDTLLGILERTKIPAEVMSTKTRRLWLGVVQHLERHPVLAALGVALLLCLEQRKWQNVWGTVLQSARNAEVMRKSL
jgi:hypothetical protein